MRNDARRALLGAFTLCVATACSRKEPAPNSTFYSREIGPVLTGSCSTSASNSSCHVYADEHENAFGNLSFESYAALNRRRDLLVDYGPYGVPGLLLKVMPPRELQLTAWDESEQLITTEISHAGGQLIDLTSPTFVQLEKWMENGAAENNAPAAEPEVALKLCSNELGTDPLFDPDAAPAGADYAQFQSEVNPVLVGSCAAGNCHGSPSNQLYLTCGTSEEQQRWNYFAAGDYVSATPLTSELLRRTLAPAQGGTYHEGGTIFRTTSDSGYQAIRSWAEAKGGPTNLPTEAGFDFFAKRVQPILAKRGCMMLGCHSAPMFHDYRLRGGSAGHFGLPATRTNYRLTLEQVALESPNPNASRLIRKNLPPTDGGILHRGGSLLADGGDPAACDLTLAETGPLNEQSPYCVLVAWIARERETRMASAAPLSAVVFVRRTPDGSADTPQDYAEYRPGSELVRRSAVLDAVTGIGQLGADEILSTSCGLDRASADIRRPMVSWDGRRIAFAARSSASEPLRIYVIDGATCAVDPVIDAPPVDEDGNAIPTNGELIHNFDPAFAPDGRLVFVSTRGNVTNTAAFDYQGPQRAPADPSKLNANLYVLEGGRIRQLTFLLNQEIAPAFMSDGRLIFTAEKRAPGFYQLAGRRMNLDGGDYHPLYAQRSSIGHNQATDVVELADKNLVFVLSDRGAAHGAGTLGIVNRSIGVDQASTNEVDYLQRPDAIDWPNYAFYQRSLRIFDEAATGRLAQTQGAYRNPSPLPDGTLLVSYAPGVTNLGNFAGGFDVYVINPVTGERTALIESADDELWPVAVYARGQHGVFRSRRDEANGFSQVYADAARRPYSEITYLDLPMLGSLLFQNTRGPERMLGPNSPVEFWESLPPEPGVTSFATGGAFVTEDEFGPLYARRRLLGAADPFSDGSAKVRIAGGLPLVLAASVQLADDAAPTRHFHREEMQFYPGEWSRQSFPREMFNALCGFCHGAREGLESGIAVRPDILTRASERAAIPARAIELDGRPPPQGPPFP